MAEGGRRSAQGLLPVDDDGVGGRLVPVSTTLLLTAATVRGEQDKAEG